MILMIFHLPFVNIPIFVIDNCTNTIIIYKLTLKRISIRISYAPQTMFFASSVNLPFVIRSIKISDL